VKLELVCGSSLGGGYLRGFLVYLPDCLNPYCWLWCMFLYVFVGWWVYLLMSTFSPLVLVCLHLFWHRIYDVLFDVWHCVRWPDTSDLRHFRPRSQVSQDTWDLRHFRPRSQVSQDSWDLRHFQPRSQVSQDTSDQGPKCLKTLWTYGENVETLRT